MNKTLTLQTSQATKLRKTSTLALIYRYAGLPRHSCCKIARQILFYGNLFLQYAVPSDICYTEAAEAQNLAYNISSAQYTLRLKLIYFFCRSPFYIAAVRAYGCVVIVFLHAAHASEFSHFVPLSENEGYKLISFK